MNHDVLVMARNYVQIPQLYSQFSEWLYIILLYTVYLTVTAALFFLADFDFEARAYQVSRVNNRERDFETDLNRT